MTSLIDIIFLLLLFFMLTSTFSKFSEVELSAQGTGGSIRADTPPLFLQLSTDAIRVNGTTLTFATFEGSVLADTQTETPVMVSLDKDVTAQRLTDLLVALRKFPRLRVTVLEG